MFINNLKIAIRNISQHKVITVINVTGLAIGLATSILILIWIQDELSFDRFQKNYHSIYRIIGNDNTLTAPQPLAPVIREEIPEIVNAARISAFPIGQLECDKTIYDERPVLADQSFFEIFTFPFIEGDPGSALENPGSMVVSQQLAKKLFGDKQALGETVSVVLLGRKFDYTIAGIMKDMPSNSHIQTNCIVSFLGFVKRLYGGDLKNWTDWSCVTYIQTVEDCHIAELKQKITGCLLKHTDNNTDYVLQQLQPLKDIHLHPYSGEYAVSGDIKYIYIFSVVAFIIILIACINYVNLTTSASIKRIKEVGIKKAIGATRVSLIRQFTIESFIIVLIALNFAILFINLLMPLFNKFTGKVLDFSFSNLSTILLIVAGIMTIGICAGFFPAWYLSSINPREIMQSKTTLPRRKVISGRMLSIVQFTLSVAVIAGSIVINRQMGYIKNMYSGFSKKNLLYFHLMDNTVGNIQFLKNKLLANPDITGVTSNYLLAAQNSQTTNKIIWEGKKAEDDVFACIQRVDFDFLKVYKVRMKEGRFFSEEFSTDNTSAFVINEAAAKAFKLEAPVGKELSLWNITGTIIGVVRDYHFKTVHQQVSPVILLMNITKNFGGFEGITLRINPENMEATIKYALDIINQHNNGYNSEYHYLDETFDNRYHSEKRLATIFNISSVLAIFISCIGLYAMISFIVTRRTKEIGIRKVNGASVLSILGILTKDIVLWVFIAVLLASPFAWYFSEKWLGNFAYKTGLALWIFLMAGAITLVVALLTMSWQSWRAASRNPVESLRYE